MHGDVAYARHAKICSDELKLRERKMHDYSGPGDALANFWVMSGIMQILQSYGMGIDITTPHGNAAYMQLIKIARFQHLVSNDVVPTNEGLRDTVIDDRVYAVLKLLCYQEWQIGTTPSGWIDG